MQAYDLAQQVAATFNESPSRFGNEWRVRCPVHEDDGLPHNPSLAIWDRGSHAVFKCMTGCSHDAVKIALARKGIRLGTTILDPAASLYLCQGDEQARVSKLRELEQLMVLAQAIEGTPVEAYLKARGLALGDFPVPPVQTLYAVQPASYGSPWGFLGVIVDLSTLRQDHPRAVGGSLLLMNELGQPRLDGSTDKKWRRVIGAQKGYAVPYGIPGPHLVVAEGVETMLSAMYMTAVPFGAAALAAPNMGALIVPEWVERVTVVPDNDPPSREAAAELKYQLGLVGVPCGIAVWETERPLKWDANDELRIEQGQRLMRVPSSLPPGLFGTEGR